VVLDIHLYGSEGTGIEALKKIRQADPNVKVLVRSADKGDDLILRAMAAGANGYVWKGESRGGLADAVVRCHEGRLVVTKSVAAKVRKAVTQVVTLKSDDIYEQPEAREYIGLTPKLKRVAELYIDGLTADQIAEKLKYSVHTVRKYVSMVHQILFAQNRYQTFKKLTARDEKGNDI
jgi:DNA-binding NarL/FixJ family response regulator